LFGTRHRKNLHDASVFELQLQSKIAPPLSGYMMSSKKQCSMFKPEVLLHLEVQ
jgi:hypothetical protein